MISSALILYPIPGQGRIPNYEGSMQHEIPVWYVKRIPQSLKPKKSFPGYNDLELGYRSFLHGAIPTHHENGKLVVDIHAEQFKSRTVDTVLGKVHISAHITDGMSTMPPSQSIEMKNIDITLTPKDRLSDAEIFEWQDRIYKLLVFINQEEVVSEYINYSFDEFFAPSLSTGHEKAQYAFRTPIGVEECFDLLELVTKKYVENYSEIIKIMPDLVMYYKDYISGMPDEIQLARLFVALEQSANLARKTEENLKSEDDTEVQNRKKEYKDYIKTNIKGNALLSENLSQFVRDSSKHYIDAGAEPDASKKIMDLAQVIMDKHELHTNLVFSSKARMVWTMRNIVAHGLSVVGDQQKTNAKNEFYSNRGLYRQNTEQLIRAYILHYLGADTEQIRRFSEPLKSYVLELYER